MREFVEINRSDIKGLDKVWSATYRNGEPWEPTPRFDDNIHFALLENGAAIAGCGVAKMTCTRGQGLMKCGGVLGVAVLPEHRRGGIGSELMRGVNRSLRYDHGYEMASLHAFREPFYRKFGYEVCGTRYGLTVDTAYLPSLTPELDIRVIPNDAYDQLRGCNARFSHARSGFNIRSDANWKNHIPAESHVRIYVAGNPVEAYCIVQHKIDFWQPQEINEFVWSTRRGYESMIAFFKQLGINKSKIQWVEPSDSPYRARFWDYSADIHSIRTQIMYRVLDVPAALRQLKPEESGEFTISMNDPDFPENNGPWQVRFSPEGIEVGKASSAQLEMAIQHFVQGFLGDPTFAQLATNELIQVNDVKGLREAMKLMPHSPTMCLEFF